MMRSILLLLAMTAMMVSPTMAQNSSKSAQTTPKGRGSLELKVVERENTALSIAGAVVEITPKSDSTATIYYPTNALGRLLVPSLPYGDYTVVSTFLGFANASVDVTIDRNKVKIPDILMEEEAINVDTVVKEIKAMRATQNGDSLIYNAAAFQVAADADVEGLLMKLPGVMVDDGDVTAQGEKVTKIYVDGREFFGSDVAAAIKTLPAEMVESIEVYDKMSDAAEFSGIDDGNSTKAINIVTKPNMREGIFGKVYAGGGYEPEETENTSNYKYLAGGSVNWFEGTSRVTATGTVNNLNQQNFSFDDIMDTGDDSNSRRRGGVGSVNSVGVNFSDVYGEDDKFELQANYSFNHNENYNHQELFRWYDGSASSQIDSLYQSQQSSSTNLNHRFGAKFNWDISDNQELMIRPSVSFQGNTPSSFTDGVRYGDPLTSERYDEFGEQIFGSSRVSDMAGYNAGISANYRYKISANGRNIALNGSYSIDESTRDGNNTTDPNYPNYNLSDTVYRASNSPTYNKNLSGGVTYVEPISKRVSLSVGYRLSRRVQESDQNSYNTDYDFVVDDESTLNSKNYASTTYLTQSIGPSLRIIGTKVKVTFGANYQDASLDNLTIKRIAGATEDEEFNINKHYKNLTYSIVGNVYFNSQNTLRLNYSSDTDSPSVSKFLDNTSSDTSVTAGNMDLEQSYNNRLSVRYIHSNLTKGSTVMVSGSAQLTNNSIVQHTILNPDPFYVGTELYDEVNTYRTAVNLDGSWRTSLNFTYGFPITFLRSNFNINAAANYSVSPSLYGGTIGEVMGDPIVGGEKITTDMMSYRTGVTLSSNISENVDFTLSWSGNYTDASNASTALASDGASTEASTTSNQYLNQTASATMKFVFFGGFTFTANASYKKYWGVTDSYDESYVLLNAYVGHKIFKNKRGELNFGAYDLLNQSTTFNRTFTSNYAQNSSSTILGRYFSFQLIYNLRSFGNQEVRRQRRQGGMGMDFGGGMGGHGGGSGGGGMRGGGMGGPGGGMGGGGMH